MQQFIQELLRWYFDTLEQFGLLGVIGLMAMESSVFPVPSELVVPPAAYLESHARGGALIFTLMVIAAATLGSYLGSGVTYWVARAIGRPLIVKYGKYILISEKKLKLAEAWVARYGAAGIFFARLLPVVRHLISIPAGIVGMRFRTFSLMTVFGSALWCTVLTIFGLVMAEDVAQLIQPGAHVESQSYKAAFTKLTWAMIALVGVVVALYFVMLRRTGSPAHSEADGDLAKDQVAE